MLSQVLVAALRILTFRAGPQDFPYAPQLTATIVTAAVLVEYVIFALVVPAPMALAWALSVVGGVSLVAHALLRARGFDNRFQQTMGALLATGILLGLMMLPPYTQTAPLIRMVAENPEILKQPESVQAPRGAAFFINLVTFWDVAVTAHIFRHAAGVSLVAGVAITIVAGLFVLLLMAFSGSLAAALMAAAG